MDVPPAVFSPHQRGYQHQAACVCGETLSSITEHSGQTMIGAQEFGMSLRELLAEHLRTALATAIYQMHEMPS
jgi:hypothetical protein